MYSSILEVFKKWASGKPEALCVVDADGEHSYGDMYDRALHMAAGLKARGAGKGCRIMAFCTGKAEYLELQEACWMLGAVFVPVEVDAAKERVAQIAGEVEPVMTVASAPLEPEKAPGIFATYDELVSGASLYPADMASPDGEDDSEILFTTGTTGKSKGVEVMHRNNVALAENIAEGVSMRQGNVELLPLPLTHSHALRDFYANVLRGGCVLLTDGVAGVKHIYDLVRNYKATAMDLSPTAANVLMKLSRGKFTVFSDQLDYIQVGTAYLNDEVKENLRKTFPGVHLYNFYGSTESGRSCVFDFSGEDKKHCIGRPTVNSTFAIMDEKHNVIESDADHMGLLASAGPMNMRGYWKQPELTATAMQNGYVFSKDEGYIDQDGFVYVLGRADDVINFRGIKISPDEIEEVAADFPGVSDCACIPKKDKMSGQVPVLVIDADEEKFDKKALMQYLREHVDADKVPARIMFFHDIPRSFNGKLKRKQLAKELIGD